MAALLLSVAGAAAGGAVFGPIGAIATSATTAPSWACTIRSGAVAIAACLAAKPVRQRNSRRSPGLMSATAMAVRCRAAASASVSLLEASAQSAA